MIYDKFERVETIIENKLPNSFYGQYEHKSMSNTMYSQFIKVNDNKTKITCEINYTRFSGFMVKSMAKVFPGILKKQVDKWLINFKQYVKKQ